MFRRAIVLAVLAAASPAWADQPAHVARAIQEADQVIVGLVSGVDAAWKVNAHGDQLIVSRAWVRTEEALKGKPDSDVPVEIEGGTIGDLTLKVSDMPTLRSGDRALFLLKKTAGGEWVPHRRGASILRVERDGEVRAVGMRLEQIRQLARQGR